MQSLSLTSGDVSGILSRLEAAQYLLYRQQVIDGGDPMPYVRFQFGEFLLLDDFQIDMVRSAFDAEVREIYVKGNTGCGKSGAAGIIACLFYDLYEDARVVISRDTYDRAVSLTFSEVVKWFKRMKVRPRGQVQSEQIVDPLNRQRLIECANPAKGEGFSGAHSEHVLFYFDEATAIPDSRYDLANTQATKFLVLANPRTTSGAFRKAFGNDDPDATKTILGSYGKRRLITVSGMDCLNVRRHCLKKAVAPPGGIEIDGRRYHAGETIVRTDFAKRQPIIPGQTCYDEYQGHLKHNDPDWVSIFAHGRFPKEDPERQAIRGSWLQRPGEIWERFHQAEERSRGRKNEKLLRKLLDSWHPVEAFGLDVALSTDGDGSVLTVGGYRGVRHQLESRHSDVHELVEWVLTIVKDRYGIDLTRGGYPLGIDCDGLGLPVAQVFRKRGVRVIEVRGSATPEIDPKTYVNKRAENYGELGRRLDPKGAYGYPIDATPEQRRILDDVVFIIPPDEELKRQILAHEKIFPHSDQLKFKITPKDKSPGNESDDKIRTIKEKLGRSPDHSDSLVYFCEALRHKGLNLDKWLDAGAF